MIDESEIENIINDIKLGFSDYRLGKKYGHSPNSIKSIREKRVEDAATQKDEAEKEKASPVLAVVEKTKSRMHSERVAKQVERIIDDEDEAFEKGRQFLESEKKQKIINEYVATAIQAKFDNYEWYAKEQVSEMIIPLKNEIVKLREQVTQLQNQNSQMKANHADEINQLNAEIENERMQSNNIFCYVCGRPFLKSRVCVPCAICYSHGYQISSPQVLRVENTPDFFF